MPHYQVLNPLVTVPAAPWAAGMSKILIPGAHSYAMICAVKSCLGATSIRLGNSS